MSLCEQCGKSFLNLKVHQRSHEASSVERSFKKGRCL